MNFKAPWSAVENGVELEQELARELSSGHQLYNLKLRAIARKEQHDDVLFEFLEQPRMVAVVQLSWSGTNELAPWPNCSVYSSMEDFLHKNQN